MAPKSKRKAKSQQPRANKSAGGSPTKYQPPPAGSEGAGRAIDFMEVLAELAQDEFEARDSLEALPPRRQAFVLHYCTNGWRGAKAARDAGYSEKTARSIAHELLTFPDVRRAVEARMKLLHMTADEVTARLSAMARADISEYLSKDSDTGRLDVDLDRLKADGLGFLIKEAGNTPNGPTIKAHDSRAALHDVARINKQLVDKVEHSAVVVTVTADNMAQAKEAVKTWESERFGEEPVDGSS